MEDVLFVGGGVNAEVDCLDGKRERQEEEGEEVHPGNGGWLLLLRIAKETCRLMMTLHKIRILRSVAPGKLIAVSFLAFFYDRGFWL